MLGFPPRNCFLAVEAEAGDGRAKNEGMMRAMPVVVVEEEREGRGALGGV